MESDIRKFLKDKVQPCDICPNLNPWRKFAIGTNGDESSSVMLVGEQPSENSINYTKNNKPDPKFWVGQNGQRIRNILATCNGIGNTKLEDIFYLTDIVKCCPPKQRKPAIEEINNCKDFLRREIEILKPKYILVFGEISFQYFIDNYMPSPDNDKYFQVEIQNDRCYHLIRFNNFYLIPLRHAKNRSMNEHIYVFYKR